MPTLRIVLCCVLAVVAIALIQELVTASVCPAYFNVGQDSSGLPFSEPILVAIFRGLQGGLGGLVLGLALGLACRLGDGPKLDLHAVWPGIVWLGATVALASLGAGIGTYWMAGLADVRIRNVWGQAVPVEDHVTFLAVSVAHVTTYLVALLGGIALCGWAGLLRHFREREAANAGVVPERQPDVEAPA